MSSDQKTIRPAADGWTTDLVAPAAERLRAGDPVIFPTETVYGIGVVDEDDAKRRLNDLKGRPSDQALTLHLSSVASIEQFAAPLSPLAHRLVDAFLPGPMTLLLPAATGDGLVGIRVPDHDAATLLIRESGGVLAATSANRHGAASAVDLATVDPALVDASAFVLDDASDTTGTDSTIVKPVGVVPEIVRDGAVSATAIRALAGPVVLLVCTGNTCRSPMASVILRRRIDEAFATTRSLPSPQIWSAGTGALGGEPASPNALAVARERSLDLSAHRSSRLTPARVMGADFILTMTASAAAVITDYFPEVAPRVTILNGEAGGVPDPYGGDVAIYRQAADAITAALDHFIDAHRAAFEV